MSSTLTHKQHASILKCCAFFLQDQDKEYVGFATLPNQVHRKTVKKGFTFTLMVAGELFLMCTNCNFFSGLNEAVIMVG